jgi:hypothetical protein
MIYCLNVSGPWQDHNVLQHNYLVDESRRLCRYASFHSHKLFVWDQLSL